MKSGGMNRGLRQTFFEQEGRKRKRPKLTAPARYSRRSRKKDVATRDQPEKRLPKAHQGVRKHRRPKKEWQET